MAHHKTKEVIDTLRDEAIAAVHKLHYDRETLKKEESGDQMKHALFAIQKLADVATKFTPDNVELVRTDNNVLQKI